MNEQETISRFEAIEKRLDVLEGKKDIQKVSILNKHFIFKDKSKEHSKLLEELLKSDFCHSKNGLTQEEILQIFKDNGRPVVPKKIIDLLHVWKKRKRIEAIKIKGEKQKRYFWVKSE